MLSVRSSAYPFVRWLCFMEVNAPSDAVQAAAQPRRRKLKRNLQTVDEKWQFHELTQQEPNRTLLLKVSKIKAQFSNPLTSSAA